MISLNGGAKDNAIPREATAIISIDKSKKKELQEIKSKITEIFKQEFHKKRSTINNSVIRIMKKS